MERIYTGEQGHHISADVAYAVRQYVLASGDDRFLLEPGETLRAGLAGIA